MKFKLFLSGITILFLSVFASYASFPLERVSNNSSNTIYVYKLFIKDYLIGIKEFIRTIFDC